MSHTFSTQPHYAYLYVSIVYILLHVQRCKHALIHSNVSIWLCCSAVNRGAATVLLFSWLHLCLSVRRSTKTRLAVVLTQTSLTAIADAELCLCCCPFFSELRDGQICSITVHHLLYRACLHHGALCLLHPPCLFTDSGGKGLMDRMNRVNQITGRGKTLLGRTVHLSPNLEAGVTSPARICGNLC